MRIVQIITPTRISGAEIYLASLSKELISMGHEVIIIVEKGQRLIEYLGQNQPVIPLKIEGKGNFFGYQRLKDKIKELNPTVIHTHLTTASWFGGWIGKKLDIPVVSTVHSIESKWPYKRASKIIAVSKAVYNNLLIQNLSEKQLEIVCNGISFVEQQKNWVGKINHEQSVLKKEWNIPQTNQVIGVVAHFSKKKGHFYLLKAFSELENENVTLVLCGEGILEEKLKNQCKELNITHRVIFTGFQNKIYKMYKLFDFLILPSIKGEGLPLSILEAQSFELPVIATFISGISEVIVSGENGYLVPPKDVEALKEKMTILLNDTKLQKKMGKIGRHKIINHFNIQTNAKQILSVYNKL